MPPKSILEQVKGDIVALGFGIRILLRNPYDKENPQLATVTDTLERAEKLEVDIKNIIKKASQHDLFTLEGGEDLDSQITAHYDSLINILREAKSILTQLTPSSTTQDLTPTNTQSYVHLPTLNLPKFSGEYENWKSFLDLFLATIDQNKTLTKAQKLTYLRGSLLGPAALVIQAYSITDENYTICLDLLKSHYDRKREIIFSFIDKLLNLPSVTHPTKDSLSQFNISVRDIATNLKTLGLDLTACNAFITRIIMKKIDSHSLESWLHTQVVDEVPNFDTLLKHLDIRSQAMETQYKTNQTPNKHQTTTYNSPKEKTAKTYNVTITNSTCPICQKSPSHRIKECQKFLTLSVPDRYKTLKDHKRCVLCFSPTHFTNNCTFRPCFLCGKLHHRLLHENREHTNQSAQSSSSSNQSRPSISSNSDQSDLKTEASPDVTPTQKTCVAQQTRKQGLKQVPLLSTVRIHLLHNNGTIHPARFLLDSASEVSIISKQLARTLGTRRKPDPIHIEGLGTANKMESTHTTLIHISSCYSDTNYQPYEFHIVDKIELTLPTRPVDPALVAFIQDKPLADPYFHTSAPIHGILGATVCAKIFTGEKFNVPNSNLAMFNTEFGWVLLGSAPALPREPLPSELGNKQTNEATKSIFVLTTNSLKPDQTSRNFQSFTSQTNNLSRTNRPSEIGNRRSTNKKPWRSTWSTGTLRFNPQRSISPEEYKRKSRSKST